MAFSSKIATTTIRCTWPFNDLSQKMGWRVHSARELLGFSREKSTDPETRITLDQADRLISLAIQVSGQHDLGLLAAEQLNSEHYSILEFAARSCSTLGEAIACKNSLYPLHSTGSDLTLSMHGPYARWTFNYKPGIVMHDAAHDFSVASLVTWIRWFIGNSVKNPFHEIRFKHAKPSDLSSHRRFFRCPIRFDMLEDAVIIPEELLELPLAHADSELRRTLYRIAEDMVGKLPRATDIHEQVQNLIAEQLAGGHCSIEAVAKSLNLSVRTLQRNLNKEGKSFRDSIDDIRYQLAMVYLKQHTLSMGEVAYLLGFSRQQNFNKAFKRWTGLTPSTYAERVRG